MSSGARGLRTEVRGGSGGVTRSVMAAPRALMALKAAWPGVSRKVRDCWLSGIFTSKAPICCTPAQTSVNVLVLYSVAMHL